MLQSSGQLSCQLQWYDTPGWVISLIAIGRKDTGVQLVSMVLVQLILDVVTTFVLLDLKLTSTCCADVTTTLDNRHIRVRKVINTVVTWLQGHNVSSWQCLIANHGQCSFVTDSLSLLHSYYA
ncbi:hypothetical protein ABBQ32_003875 [Trebouxia sp. C0010 RCD-2024]